MMVPVCNTPCAPNTDPQQLELFCEEKVVLQIAANVFSETPLLCWNSQEGLWRILSVSASECWCAQSIISGIKQSDSKREHGHKTWVGTVCTQGAEE